MPTYVGPYSPEWYDDLPLVPYDVGVESGDAAATSWVSYLPDILKSAGQTAAGILQTTRGVYTDVYGRLWKDGQLVTNYAPTGTLGGLVGGLSLTSLLILGVVAYLLLRK